MQGKPRKTEKIMEFDELKTKYTELRKRYLTLQADENIERRELNVSLENCRRLEQENEALRRRIDVLQKEKFNREFPPIEE